MSPFNLGKTEFLFLMINDMIDYSADGKYILTGGEDDLVQVWSMEERRVVARGEGHNSWVNFLSDYIKLVIVSSTIMVAH